MKILFVLRSAGYFPYHQTTIDHLIARGHQVSLLFENKLGRPDDRGFEEWLAQHRHEVTIGDAVKRQGFLPNVLFAIREARSYASYCRRGPEVKFYRERWRRYLPGWLAVFVDYNRAAATLFRAVERVTPASRQIVSALRRDRPDCIVASPTNMLHDEEVEYVKAAKALDIPTVVPVLSWDNLTTKGLFHVAPDYVLAWHHGHQEEAQEIHAIPGDRIVIAGSPFFDKWFNEARVSSRTVACGRIGVDPRVPYVLYLGSSANIARDESWLVLALVQALSEASDAALRRLQVVFKPHPGGSPRNVRALPRLDEAGVLVWSRERGRPDTRSAINEFRDALHHAAIVAGINTTGMVDAILCDRPCLAVAVKRYESTQTHTTHFRRMQESNALLVARSVRRAAQIIGETLAGDDRTSEARKRFVATYARPRGVGARAGEAAGMAIELACQRLSATAITEAIDRELANRPPPEPPFVEPEPNEATTLAR